MLSSQIESSLAPMPTETHVQKRKVFLVSWIYTFYNYMSQVWCLVLWCWRSTNQEVLDRKHLVLIVTPSILTAGLRSMPPRARSPVLPLQSIWPKFWRSSCVYRAWYLARKRIWYELALWQANIFVFSRFISSVATFRAKTSQELRMLPYKRVLESNV